MSGENYDYLVLGEGNPLHPVNCEVGNRFSSHDLKECLNYFYAYKEPEALEMAIDFHVEKLEKIKNSIIELTHVARSIGNDLIANKLCQIRNEVERND